MAKRLVLTQADNIVKFKDRYCANYTVEENHIIVVKGDSFITVNRNKYPASKELVDFAYMFAGNKGGCRNLTPEMVRFIIAIGAAEYANVVRIKMSSVEFCDLLLKGAIEL